MHIAQYDVIVIGGGIAGLSAATAIARNSNLTIALIEGKGIGSNNPSPLTFADILQTHDLQDCVKANYSSFAFHNYQGSFIRYVFKGYPLVVLDYKKACSKLLSIIRERLTLFSLIEKQAVEISQTAGIVEVTLEDGQKIDGKIAIDCSGKSQLVAKQWLKPHVSHYSHVYGGIFVNVIDVDETNGGCFLWPCRDFGSGGGWFYPLRDRKASFGYAMISDALSVESAKLRDGFHKALHEFEPYSRFQANAKLENMEKGIIPITYTKQFVFKNVLVAGDAGGMATSWTCMGIEPALKFGRLAGELAVKAIMGNNYGMLQEFQYTWDMENKAVFESFAAKAKMFWTQDRGFWEWIIKNDLAYLSPVQALERIRRNEHLLKKHQIVWRALVFKMRALLSKSTSDPAEFIVRG